MTSPADLAIDIAERIAILEVDAGLDRADAERMALAEIIDVKRAEPVEGILGELPRVDRLRHVAPLRDALDAAGLGRCRAPAWGVAEIVIAGYRFRFALPGETSTFAIVVPVDDPAGGVADLAAQALPHHAIRTRLGVGTVVGRSNVQTAIENGWPLMLFGTLAGWLRGGSRGAVVCNWQDAGRELDGVRALRCHPVLAPKLHDATRRCWPQPVIFVATTIGEAPRAA